MPFFIIAIASFLIFGFWGGILAILIASSLFRYQNYGAGAMNPFNNANRQQVFFQTIFVCAGYIAKADDKVSRDEIEHIELIIKQMRLDSQSERLAKQLFRDGVAKRIDLDQQLQQFKAVCGNTRHLRQTLIQLLISIVLADDIAEQSEIDVLTKIAKAINISDYELEQFLRMAQSSQNFNNEKSTESQLKEAYNLLDAKPSDDMSTITKKYRRLMSKNHPDKLAGQGLPKSMIDIATKKSQEISTAYDLIKKFKQ